MKIFLSWSGDRSKKVAELLEVWIKCVIQAVEPWVSSNGIDRGALWFSAISSELANTSVGIVCLTKENKDKPWILFESGALAKGLDSNLVCTFLIDLKSNDLGSPLSHFNHTTATKPGLYSLVKTINFSLGVNALGEKILENVFETYWPQFDSSFKQIIKDTPETTITEQRSESDIMLEILSSVRSFDRRITNIEKESLKPQRTNPVLANTPRYVTFSEPNQINQKFAEVSSFIQSEISSLMEQGVSERTARRKVNDKYGLLGSTGTPWSSDETT